MGTNEPRYGQHEPVLWYQQCRARNRNTGLFTADRNMNNRNRARNTRQNPNGNRSGTECPEERDYYPYWLPTPWRDIAVLTSNVSRCSYYIEQSQNTLAKGKCSDVSAATRLECDNAPGGQWIEGKSWDELDEGGEPAPECMESFWNLDSKYNGDDSPVEQDEAVDVPAAQAIGGAN